MTTSAAKAPLRMRRGPAILLVVLSVLSLGILVALGNWQVERLHWKENLLATIDARIDAEPASLSDVGTRLATTGDIEYWPVRVEGTFRHEGERHFFATHRGQSGFYIYTPLELGNGRIILVNRGFVPYELKTPESRPESLTEGTVTVTGLARRRLDEKPSFIVPDNEPGSNMFYWKDWRVMAETSGVGGIEDYVPFFIDADDTPNPGGLPVGGVTIIDLPNNHLQYAVTWYGLALALVGVLGYWGWRSWRERRAEHRDIDTRVS